MGAVGLFFLSKRKHDRVEWIEFVIQVFLHNLRLKAFAIGFVAHDLLCPIVYTGVVGFVCGNIRLRWRLIHSEGRSRHASSCIGDTTRVAIATTNTQMSECIHRVW